jgi:hypothetical protein
MIDNQYQTIFENTDYWVDPNGLAIELHIGQLWEEIWSERLLIESFAIITACNPLPTILPEEENQARQEALRLLIVEGGWSYLPAVGIARDQQWREESWAILGINPSEALALGQNFGQVAIVYASRAQGVQLVYC